MSKSSFAVLIACGCLVACLPRFIAPTDNYISDAIIPSESENDYFGNYIEPEIIYIDNVTLSQPTAYISLCYDKFFDIPVSCEWEYSTGYYWSSIRNSRYFRHFGNICQLVIGSSTYPDLYTARTVFLRCKYTDSDNNVFYSDIHAYSFVTERQTSISLDLSQSEKYDLKEVSMDDLIEEPMEEPTTEEQTEEMTEETEDINEEQTGYETEGGENDE